ncbi:Serine/threonine-protein kinase haspin [Thoreauomyces humboldtii]|nr:Serine/threonine-protein kinase haspin [Thoreauomyces humboldtii]
MDTFKTQSKTIRVYGKRSHRVVHKSTRTESAEFDDVFRGSEESTGTQQVGSAGSTAEVQPARSTLSSRTRSIWEPAGRQRTVIHPSGDDPRDPSSSSEDSEDEPKQLSNSEPVTVRAPIVTPDDPCPPGDDESPRFSPTARRPYAPLTASTPAPSAIGSSCLNPSSRNRDPFVDAEGGIQISPIAFRTRTAALAEEEPLGDLSFGRSDDAQGNVGGLVGSLEDFSLGDEVVLDDFPDADCLEPVRLDNPGTSSCRGDQKMAPTPSDLAENPEPKALTSTSFAHCSFSSRASYATAKSSFTIEIPVRPKRRLKRRNMLSLSLHNDSEALRSSPTRNELEQSIISDSVTRSSILHAAESSVEEISDSGKCTPRRANELSFLQSTSDASPVPETVESLEKSCIEDVTASFLDLNLGHEDTASPPKLSPPASLETLDIRETSLQKGVTDLNPVCEEPASLSEPQARELEVDKAEAFRGRASLPPIEAQAKADTITGLDQLLALAGQASPTSFESFLNGSSVVDKIGEASYSSVFSMTFASHLATPAAVKIIPFHVGLEGHEDEEVETMNADEVCKEVAVTKKLGGMNGFVKLLGLGVCHGPWPTFLSDIWDAWTEPSENTHPSDLLEDQLYALVVLPNGGKDIEHCSPFMPTQCRSIMQQLVVALASAEEHLKFEHRDLHWGNCLVRSVEDPEESWILDGTTLGVPLAGVKVCVIDYTWGRIGEAPDLTYVPLEDPSLFTGSGKGQRGGDLQFDIYRMMRTETRERWEGFFPRTNIFWIHYLLDKLITKRMAPIPRSSTKKARESIMADRKAMDALRDRVLNYASCRQMVEAEIIMEGGWLGYGITSSSRDTDGLSEEFENIRINT